MNNGTITLSAFQNYLLNIFTRVSSKLQNEEKIVMS